MHVPKRKHLILWTAIAFILIGQTTNALFQANLVVETPTSPWLADLFAYALICLWILEDAKDHPQIVRPFDFGFLLYLFVVFYLPYYVFKTRGYRGVFSLLAVIVACLSYDYFLYDIVTLVF